MITTVLPILLLVLLLPVAWLISEFSDANKSVRCSLGILAILSCFGVAFIAAQMVRLNYNIWYSSATAKLIDSTITKLNQDKTGEAIEMLTDIRSKMSVTYERKGNYDELVRDAIKGGDTAPSAK